MIKIHNPITKLLKPFYSSKNRPWEEGRKDCEACIETALRLSIAACSFFILQKTARWSHKLGEKTGPLCVMGAGLSFLSIDWKSAAYLNLFCAVEQTFLLLNQPFSSLQTARVIAHISTGIAYTISEENVFPFVGILNGNINKLSVQASHKLASFCGYNTRSL